MDTPLSLAVSTRGLRKDFGKIKAVDGLDLEVEVGSFFGFLGPNGAGKSTTIRILTGMLLPTGRNAFQWRPPRSSEQKTNNEA